MSITRATLSIGTEGIRIEGAAVLVTGSYTHEQMSQVAAVVAAQIPEEFRENTSGLPSYFWAVDGGTEPGFGYCLNGRSKLTVAELLRAVTMGVESLAH